MDIEKRERRIHKTLTLEAAKAERARRRHPHRVVSVFRHAELCLYSDGTIIPAYPCTCRSAKHAGYTLVLGSGADDLRKRFS